MPSGQKMDCAYSHNPGIHAGLFQGKLRDFKSSSSCATWAHGSAFRPFLDLSQTPTNTLRYGARASCGVPVHCPDFTGTHYTYPQRDGQAELTWVTYRQSPIPVLTRPNIMLTKVQWCQTVTFQVFSAIQV